MTGSKDYYKLNAARCLRCETTLVATSGGELHECSCGNLVVTGDKSSCGIQRYVGDRQMYQELSLYDTGHPISPGHAYVRPLTALEPMRPGRWFVQSRLDNTHSVFFKRLDEYGQELEVDEIEIGEDGYPWSKAIFRFYPVAGYSLKRCGDITQKSIKFHCYILNVVAPRFVERGQTKEALIKVLLDEDHQDRSGMSNDTKWRT